MTVVEAYSVEVIKLILSTTFTGSIVSFVLFIFKLIIKDKLSKTFQYYMWISAVIALMLPISKLIVIPISDQSMTSIKPVYDIVQWISDTASETPVKLVFIPQNKNGQSIRQITQSPSIAVMLFICWQVGMMLTLGFHMICYASYVRRLDKHNRSADRQEIEALNNLLERKRTLRLYKNSIVETPILIGFFRPEIILPDKKYEDMRLQNILLHEITHMKRHDI